MGSAGAEPGPATPWNLQGAEEPERGPCPGAVPGALRCVAELPAPIQQRFPLEGCPPKGVFCPQGGQNPLQVGRCHRLGLQLEMQEVEEQPRCAVA